MFLNSMPIWHMFVATTFFSLVQVSVKWVSHLPTHQVVFSRALVALVISYSFLRFKKIPAFGHRKGLLLLRGAFGTIALFLYFYTLQTMPLSTAVSLHYLTPVMTVLLACWIVKESPGFKSIIFLSIAFLGVFFIKGFEPSVSWLGVLASVVSCFFAGLAYNVIRLLRGTEHYLVIIFYFPFVALLAFAPYTLTHWEPISWEDIGALGIVGVSTHLAQVFMTKAYQFGKAASITVVNYVGICYALLFGYFLYGEILSFEALFGVLLIISAVVLNAYSTSK